MQPPQEEVKAGAPEWVVTFGDMMSLLLCFFVLLLSFSTMEVQKFKVVAGFVREAFGVQKQEHVMQIPSGQTVVSVEFNQPNKNKEIIFESIVEELAASGLEDKVEAEIEDDGVRIRVDGSLLFEPAQTALEPAALGFLDGVARTILESGSTAIVEGHTDDVPILSSQFPSNWELSGARAGAVVRHLADKGIPGTRLEAVGYADTRPLADNATTEGRRKNRRVELMLRPPK